MSLVGFAIRLAVQRLLVDRTWAGDRVQNSPIDPVTDLLEGEVKDKPLIAVFTNDYEGDNEGRDIGGRTASMDLILFAYLPPTIVRIDEEAGEIEFEARDAGGASALDLIGHQIRTALVFGPAVWRRVYEAMVVQITKVRARPILVELDKGIRLPAREIILSLKVVPEPDIAKPLGPHWTILHQAMLTDDNASPIADLLKNMIEQPADLPTWRQAQANLATSVETVRALGIAPVDATEEDEAALRVQQDLVGPIETVPPDSIP